MHPLPARPTGRAGMETSAIGQSDDAFDTRSLADRSTTDLVAEPAVTPYSLPVPDLPPIQQYHDDSASYGRQFPQQEEGFYDPYRGPVPRSITSPVPEDPYGVSDSTRAVSPGPYAAYGAPGARRTPSPGPQVVYAGRTPSPGPQNAFGLPRTSSPSPYVPYDNSPYRVADQRVGE